MSKYSFKARDENNRIITGTTEGLNEGEILDKLSEKNQIPIAIEELNFDGTRKDWTFIDKINDGLLRMQNRVPYKTVVFFTRQFATMIHAGVPIIRALRQLAESEKPVFKRIITSIAEDISRGSNLHEAVEKHPGAFSTMYVAVIHSGEIAGALENVLEQLATYMENTEALRQKVKGATRYPVFITLFVVVLMVLILWKLVPTFEKLYAGFNTELPKPTQLPRPIILP